MSSPNETTVPRKIRVLLSEEVSMRATRFPLLSLRERSQNSTRFLESSCLASPGGASTSNPTEKFFRSAFTGANLALVYTWKKTESAPEDLYAPPLLLIKSSSCVGWFRDLDPEGVRDAIVTRSSMTAFTDCRIVELYTGISRRMIICVNVRTLILLSEGETEYRGAFPWNQQGGGAAHQVRNKGDMWG